MRGLWDCEPRAVVSTFSIPDAHQHIGVKLRLWTIGSCPGHRIVMKVNDEPWWSSPMPTDNTCNNGFSLYSGVPLKEGLNCYQDVGLRKRASGGQAKVSIAVEATEALPMVTAHVLACCEARCLGRCSRSKIPAELDGATNAP